MQDRKHTRNPSMKHMNSHNGKNPYHYALCGKFFISRRHINWHMTYNAGKTSLYYVLLGIHLQKLPKATHADLYLWESIELWSVLQRIHLQEPHERPWRVMIGIFQIGMLCVEKEFISRNHSLRHMNSHTAKNPCLCALCGQGFISKNQMKRHMKSHARENPSPCQLKLT